MLIIVYFRVSHCRLRMVEIFYKVIIAHNTFKYYTPGSLVSLAPMSNYMFISDRLLMDNYCKKHYGLC